MNLNRFFQIRRAASGEKIALSDAQFLREKKIAVSESPHDSQIVKLRNCEIAKSKKSSLAGCAPIVKSASLTVLFLCALIFSGCEKKSAPGVAEIKGPKQLVIPKEGAYTGAYIDFGDTEDDVTLAAINRFQELVGKHQAIVASSSYWGRGDFPALNLQIISDYGAIPLVFWSPWGPPYEQYDDESEIAKATYISHDAYSLTAILAGKWDAYIDMWAEHAKQYGKPFFVSLMNEANGTWFPWSGYFYGAGTKIQMPDGSFRYEGSETYKKAYRYIVDRVRAKGATNVLWVFHMINYSMPQDLWNYAAAYYPGDQYVDWLGLSVYGKQSLDDAWSDFSPIFKDGKKTGGLLEWPYAELCKINPTKPIMLTEWGVGEYPNVGDKAKWIREGFAEMKKYPRIKAAIYWHERWQNENGDYSNLHVNSDPESLDAYRAGVADPHWLGYPIYEPKKPAVTR